MDGDDTRGKLAAQLAVDYAAAHYFVSIGHKEWLFGVGRPAAEIERQLPADSYLFITAWNPAPEAASRADNLGADERLQRLIRTSALVHHTSLGSNAQGGAVEYGWLVLDAPVQTADSWARQFGQAAVLYWKRGEPVRLRMLWPRPDGSVDQPHTDWAS